MTDVTADAPGWLVQEVSDLLDASSVGLYEFIWLLRGTYPGASPDELRAWAAEALRRLLAEDQGQLVLQEWPSDSVLPGAPAYSNSAADWADPAADRPYLALSRS